MTEHVDVDFFHDTPSRIMGSETEFTMQKKALPPLESVTAIRPHTIHLEKYHDRVWLGNGGRLYYDTPFSKDAAERIVEYAGPECLGGNEVMLYEKAGEYLAALYGSEVSGYGTRFPVYKRTGYWSVYGKDGQLIITPGSIGHHENYDTPLCNGGSYVRKALLSYLLTRPTWAGAGLVTDTGFHISQKQSGIDFASLADGRSSGSMTAHGRKVPLRFRNDRLEVRCGDGNMSPWAIRTKFAMTSLVLRLIEHKVFPKSALLDVDDPKQLVAFAANDPKHKVAPDLSVTAHQIMIAEAGLDFAERYTLPSEEQQAATDIRDICIQIERSPSIIAGADMISDRVDWAAKLRYIREQTGIRAVQFSDITTGYLPTVQCDLLWEALGEASPSTKHYRETGNIVDQALVQNALYHPPSTRAAPRTEFIKDHPEAISQIFWQRVNTRNDSEKFIMFSPYPKKHA